MVDEARVQQLLEQILESNRTPEEVCSAYLDLLPEVRQRLGRVRGVKVQPAGLASQPATPPQDMKSQSIETQDHQPASEEALDAMRGSQGIDAPTVPGYELLAVLGHGGMGVVYKARHLKLNRVVALKMIKSGAYADAYEVARFRVEAEAVARLQHPNIVQIHEVGAYGGLPYFALEYCAGGRLDKKLHDTLLPPREAALLVEQLARAMDHAHSQQVVHRDLKPANVLLAADGTPKVADFGLAKKLDDEGLTESGARMGTPPYMAPEQAAGKTHELGPAVDVYALGAILYKLLTGRPPFQGVTDRDTLIQVMENDPVPPSRLQPKTPRDLETICLKCLQKEPGRRYASALELADDLRRFGAGEPIQARPVGGAERAWKWTKRRPAAAALIAALLVLTLGGSGSAFWYVNDRAERRLEDALRDAEAQASSKEANHEVNDALEETERHLADVRSHVDHPLKVAVYLSDIDLWQTTVEKAHKACQRAKSASLGREALLSAATSERLRSTQTLLEREENCFALGKELDGIRLEGVEILDKDADSTFYKLANKHEQFFTRQGIPVRQAEKQSSVTSVQRSPIRFVLVAALDHWACLVAKKGSKDHQLLPLLLEISRGADPDLWRDEFRKVEVWNDREKLNRLAAEVNVAQQPPSALTALVFRLAMVHGDATSVMKQALLYYSRDLWLQYWGHNIVAEGGERIARGHAMLAIRPYSVSVALLLAAEFSLQSDWSGLLAASKRANDLDPKNARTYLFLGCAYSELNRLPEAIEAFRTAIRIDPKTPAGYCNYGISLYMNKDMPGAITALNKAIEFEPHNIDAQYHLGLAFYAERDLPGAIAVYQKALRINPDYMDPDYPGHEIFAAAFLRQKSKTYASLGIALSDLRNLPEAADAFKKATEADPTNATAHGNLGVALQQQKKLPEAMMALKKAIELNPKYAKAHYNLGNVLVDLKRLPEAVGEFNKAIEFDPNHASAYNNLGVTLRNLKDPSAAVKALNRSIELRPKNVGAYINLGDALLAQKNPSAAVAAFNTAIHIDPKNALAHCNLSLTLRQMGDFAEALQAVKKGHSLGSQQPGWTIPSALRIVVLERLIELKKNEPTEPIPLATASKGIEGQLAKQEPLDVFSQTLKSYRKSHPLQLKAGQAYQIDLASDDFDVFLRVEDINFLTLAFNDDMTPAVPPRGNLNSRPVFTPEKDGVYRLVVTSFDPGKTGKYVLTCREVNKVGATQIVKGELKKPDNAPPSARMQMVHKVDLVAGRPYVFELDGRFNNGLVLLDLTGKQRITQNDRAGDFIDTSRIDFTPKEAGIYHLVVTTTQPGESGPYTLRIQEYEPTAPAAVGIRLPAFHWWRLVGGR